MKTIQVGNLTIDGSRLFLIAGPCVIEGCDRTLMIGREVKRICEKLGVQYILKHLLIRQIVLLIILFVVRGWRKVFEF